MPSAAAPSFRWLTTPAGPVEVRVRRSARSRRARVVVRPGGLAEVVLPAGAGARTVDAILREHAGWIGRHVARLSAQAAASAPVAAEQAGAVLLGERWLAVSVAAGPRSSVRREGARLRISGPPDELPAALGRWYRRAARTLLEESVAAHAERLAAAPKRVSVRDQATRWGSCSSRGSLSFSWRLALVPPPVLDYVVVHELCHLREANHGPRFWRLVGEALPATHAAARAWLRTHEAGILAYRPGVLLARRTARRSAGSARLVDQRDAGVQSW